MNTLVTLAAPAIPASTMKSAVARPLTAHADEKPYVYVLVRTDISIEQQLVQASHAALEAGFRFERPREVASVIVLSVPDLAALEEASRRLDVKGVDHHVFFEPDFGMGHSALATCPLTKKAQRHMMRKYPLYRFSPAPVPAAVAEVVADSAAAAPSLAPRYSQAAPVRAWPENSSLREAACA